MVESSKHWCSLCAFLCSRKSNCSKTFITYKGSKSLKVFFILSEEIVMFSCSISAHFWFSKCSCHPKNPL